MTVSLSRLLRCSAVCSIAVLTALAGTAQDSVNAPAQLEHPETRALVALVDAATKLVQADGESAFDEFRVDGSRWRQGETYVFVLDPDGNMLVHPDPVLEGKNQLHLVDIDGRPIIRGLLAAATTFPDKPQGWYHYEWPVPGAILPRWKSSYVRLVSTPSGARYVVGVGMYDDRMERGFVVDLVTDAVRQIEANGQSALPLLHDRTGPFMVKDTYVFVFDRNGIELSNPAFPNLEGRNLLDVRDTQGKYLVREMLEVVEAEGSGWVDYLWPKAGESVSTLKSTYVAKARWGEDWVVVGSGVYLADAPKESRSDKLTAQQIMALVREGAEVLEQQGERAYAEFRRKGSEWFRDDTYFFVWTVGGLREFHAADPSIEGEDARDAEDVLGRPYGRMFLDVAASTSGEGWVHYMYPEPGDIFPAWKSTFLKRVRFPSGEDRLVGSGIYNMQMDRTFIEDIVSSAAALVAARGPESFAELRDKTSRYVFMDTYVFVDTPAGVELVNPAQPSLEGQDISELRDARGKMLASEYIAAAMQNGSAWVEYYWYKPGHNTAARKQTYVRKVTFGDETYIVGSGLYEE